MILTFDIPRELKGNENKLREYLEKNEGEVAKNANYFRASFTDFIVLSFDKCLAFYHLIHTEDW